MKTSFNSVLFVMFIGFLTLSSSKLGFELKPTPISPYLNGIFPARIPGASGALELIDPMPDLTMPAPVRIIENPMGDDVFVLNKNGEVWSVSIQTQSQRRILDITDRTFGLGEAGAVGMILHPDFATPGSQGEGVMFLFYRSTPTPDQWTEEGYNRLSKFRWDDGSQAFDPSSEEILIQQYDRCTWHNGGGMFFDDEGYLYLSLGDEGKSEFIQRSTQKIDQGLFSGILRIDIDNDSIRSHPIRRQPAHQSTPIKDWDWETYSQGYSIPNDNPWVSEDGSNLEEYFALGLRSPYSTSYDAFTKKIWVADVGSDVREEISIIESGDNLQWPYQEGYVRSMDHDKPTTIIGTEKTASYEYERSFGTCIIGGQVYRGAKYRELEGKYLFADYTFGKIMALKENEETGASEVEILIGSIEGSDIELPPEPGITGIYPLSNGEILVTVMASKQEDPGKIYQLKAKEFVADPPNKLSDLGVFTNLENLTPIDALIPYEVNSPLWSDGALKKRWMALPNDGSFDSPNAKIKFEENSEWTFPEGTVFVKHFEIGTEDSAETRKLETRFFIIGPDNQKYGLTYKWNEEQTDALLLTKGVRDEFDIDTEMEVGKSFTWGFPSRPECMTCHNSNAGYVLGVNTHQLNSSYNYSGIGIMNQLDYLHALGAFNGGFGTSTQYEKSYHIGDQEASLDQRVRSYLDSNCAPCHRPGGIKNTTMDLRYTVPLALQGMINQPTSSQASNQDLTIVKPGEHESSELWIRDASVHSNRMPPLSTNLLDEEYLEVLVNWINSLHEDAGSLPSVFIYPNPASHTLQVRLDDSWPSSSIEIKLWTLHGDFVTTSLQESRSFSLDISAYQSGIYLLEMSANDKHLIRQVAVQ